MVVRSRSTRAGTGAAGGRIKSRNKFSAPGEQKSSANVKSAL
jgi:hypothetical protein